jgi:metallo-beta-lactamase family protein
VIVGFQAEGSIGRQIVDGAEFVTIFGQKVAVKAKVFTIGGFSAHADQADLLGWVGHFSRKSRPRVFVIHGEPTSSDALAAAVKDRFGLDAYVPRWKEVLTLEPRKAVPAVAPETIPVDLRENALALATDLEVEIARLRKRFAAKERKVSSAELEKLRGIRDELEALAAG